MYESPINAICSEITHKILKNQEENMMLEVQQAIGYAVDKDELIKALKYDRDQYEKGFRDGLEYKAMDTWGKFGFEHTGCFVRNPKDGLEYKAMDFL